MTLKSTWVTIETNRDHKIIFIEDVCDKTGSMSITNDAEDVLRYWRESLGWDWRVVYKDTNNEWWEIVAKDFMGVSYQVGFERWHGLTWDILKRD